MALVAVLLVSRVGGETSGSSGLRYALVAGCGLGLFNVLIAQVTPGLVFGPLAILRATQALLIVGFIVVAGASWRLPRSIVPGVLLVGVLDMSETPSSSPLVKRVISRSRRPCPRSIR